MAPTRITTMRNLRERVGAWSREPARDFDDAGLTEYAYEHDSGWMTVRIEGSDEHGWRVQGSTDYRNEIYITPRDESYGSFAAAARQAYEWMGMHSDISRWTKMDRASEWARDDEHDYTENPPDHVEAFDFDFR